MYNLPKHGGKLESSIGEHKFICVVYYNVFSVKRMFFEFYSNKHLNLIHILLVLYYMAYWLFKSEPFKFSFEDLKNSPNQTTTWDGIRNYQARNFLRDKVKLADIVLFYHSRCNPPGIVGVAEVTREAYPDHTAWDVKSDYFDAKASPENPRWLMVDIQYREDLCNMVTLQEMKANTELDEMLVVKRGQRLSIQPVEAEHVQVVMKMGGMT